VTAGVTEADDQVKLESGQMFTQEDDDGLRQVAVLGSGIKEFYFGDSDAVGQSIKIKGKTFKVMGTLKSRGSMMGMMSFDDLIYLPLQTMQKKIDGTDYIREAVYKIKDMDKLDLTVAQTTDKMRELHNIDDPNDDDFAVNTIIEVLNILDTVFFALNALLLALTSISLIVGGVGIMNVMYVAVAERTFEIGLKKSIGARNSSILWQFLFEAIFLTILGGLIGVTVGFVITKLAELVAANFGYAVSLSVTWWSVAVGAGFSAVVGIIFGYWPARNASRLTPMDALRRE
jgi:putative ABC transport system permease protein